MSAELEGLRRAAITRFQAGVPQARIVRIPNATHGILGDNGPEVVRVLLDWLRSPVAWSASERG